MVYEKQREGQEEQHIKPVFQIMIAVAMIIDRFLVFERHKKIYEQHYNIIHSRCYEEYGLKRTGCAGCPFGQNFEDELLAMKKYEPGLYKAVNHIFKDTYEYTRKYKEFVFNMKKGGVCSGN